MYSLSAFYTWIHLSAYSLFAPCQFPSIVHFFISLHRISNFTIESQLLVCLQFPLFSYKIRVILSRPVPGVFNNLSSTVIDKVCFLPLSPLLFACKVCVSVWFLWVAFFFSLWSHLTRSLIIQSSGSRHGLLHVLTKTWKDKTSHNRVWPYRWLCTEQYTGLAVFSSVFWVMRVIELLYCSIKAFRTWC